MDLIGLDIGSSSIKGGRLNCRTGAIERVEREAFPGPLPAGSAGFFEVSPDAILAAAERVLARISADGQPAQLRICSQMGGILLVDGRGQAVTPYLSWRDQRALFPQDDTGGQSFLDDLRQRLGDDDFEELGKELKPGSALTLLAWLKQTGQLPEAVQPLTIGDFVISQLCGCEPRLHRTHALGLLNLRNGDWHESVLDRCGLGGLKWPRLAGEHEVIGEWDCRGRAIPVYPAIGDQQAALKGIRLRSEELSLNISTGSQVSRITPEFQPGACQTRCWFGGQFLNTVTHIPAGRSLTVLFELLTELGGGVDESAAWRRIAQLVDQSAGTGLQCDLSFFAAATGDSGTITGISTENLTVGNLFYSAFAFMADSYYRFAIQLDPAQKWDQLAVSGGLVQRFETLRRLLQARFGCGMREVTAEEETLSGLLNLAEECGDGL